MSLKTQSNFFFKVLGLVVLLFCLALFFVDLEYVWLYASLTKYSAHPVNSNIQRLVISMSTFSHRVRGTSLLAIKSLIIDGSGRPSSYEQMIISIPLVFRSGIQSNSQQSAQLSHAEIVRDVMSFYSAALGEFTPALYNEQTAFNNTARSIYVQFLMEDFGPATKLLGALLIEKDPNTIILTVDDDIQYSPLLLSFIRYNAPPNAAFSAVCQTRASSNQGFLTIHDGAWGAKWLWRTEPKICPGWLVGWAGVAYRAHFFTSDVFNVARNMSHACFLNDDVWLSGHLRSKGIMRVVHSAVPGGHHYRHPTLSLSVIPDSQGSLMAECAEEMGFI